MLNIDLEVKDFRDEDKTNYETDERKEKNMKEVCIIIAYQKSDNTKHIAKYDKQPLRTFCREKNE